MDRSGPSRRSGLSRAEPAQSPKSIVFSSTSVHSVPGLPDVAPGLPDVASRSLNDEAKSGVSDDGAESGVDGVADVAHVHEI